MNASGIWKGMVKGCDRIGTFKFGKVQPLINESNGLEKSKQPNNNNNRTKHRPKSLLQLLRTIGMEVLQFFFFCSSFVSADKHSLHATTNRKTRYLSKIYNCIFFPPSPGTDVRVRDERFRRPAIVLRNTRGRLGLHGHNGARTEGENTGGRPSHARLSM